MSEKPQENEVAQETPNEKKEYHSPELREYGTLRELTAGSGPTSPYTDSPPITYATTL